MSRGPRVRRPKYDEDGVPIDGRDWDAADWQILWEGLKVIKAAIAARHREKARAACLEATNGDGGTIRP